MGQRSRRYVRGFSALATFLTLVVGQGAIADGPGLPGGAGSGVVRSWGAVSGSTLKDTLMGWSGAAGWTVIWDTEYDYYMRASAQFRGTYEDAVVELVDAVHRSNPELSVTLYRGNRVLYVETLLVETQ
jgi:hypothetical protein